MKNALLFPFILFSTVLFAQDPCTQLEFISIQYSPFTDTTIIVHVENSSSEIFDYPGFVLIDASGDTVAKEDVNLFGIGSESVHRLEVRPGVHDPLNNLVGDLELHTGFYDVLECDWQLDQSLCADDPCDSLIITFQNWGGALVLGDFRWSLTDSDQAVVDSGTFTMEATFSQYWENAMCLQPDTYNYTLTALGPPSGGGPVMTAESSSSFATPNMIEYFEWWNQPTTVLEIPFNTFCAQSPNNIEDPSIEKIEVDLFYDYEIGVLNCSEIMESITLYSTVGQQVAEIRSNSTSFRLPKLAPGTYIAVVSTQKGQLRSKMVLQ